MKLLIWNIIWLMPLMLSAQSSNNNYAAIDRKVVFIKEVNIDSLSKKLDVLGKTDREKVRAIFRWITIHIDYNVKIFSRNKTDPGNFFEDPDDTAEILPSLNDRVAAKVLRRKIAFCDGYSRLFKALCDRAGIPAEIIHGYARVNQSMQKRFSVNHSWNAVYIDSAWHLLDVTWASGFVSYGNEYVSQYNNFYFLTTPEDFFQDHYPEDIQWTLLKHPPLYREFNQQPFRHSGFKKFGISSFAPQKGTLVEAVGDTIRFEIQTGKEVKHFFATPDFQPDSLFFFQPASFTTNAGKINVSYTVTGIEGDWLYIFCNEEIVLRYKLNIRMEGKRKE